MLLAELGAPELTSLAVKWWGPPGAIIVVLAVAIWYLYRDNKRIQEKRVTEAKESSEKSQMLAKEMASTMSDATVSIQALAATVEHMRDIVVLAAKGR